MGRKLLFLALTTLFYCAVSSQNLSAQEPHKSDPIDPGFVMPDASKFDKTKKDQKLELSNLEKGIKSARSNSQEVVGNVFRGITDLNAAKAEFDRHYNGLIFPTMTQIDDESLNKLGENRDELLRDIQGTPNDSAIRKHMLDDLVLPYFSRIAADNGYHPAVRLNAVLIIGSVNRRDGQRNVAPSLPMDSAMRMLVSLASAADTPAYLKIGALAGILRHAGIYGQMDPAAMDKGLRDPAIQLAIAILDATATPADGKPLSDEQYWMRRQAVQILGAFREPGDDGKAVAALRKILDDPNTPMWLAADTVDAYGKMRFASSEQADVANAVKSIANVVNRFFKADVQAIDDYIATIKENRMIEKRSVDEVDTTSTDDDDDAGALDAPAGARGGKGGGKGAAPVAATPSSAASIEFPNYKINDVRQRTKSIVFVARRALDGLAPRRKNEVKPAENLKSFVDEKADPATWKTIVQLVATLDKVMEQTDLSPVKAISPTAQVAEGTAPKKPETNDERLRNALIVGINSIESLIGATNAPDQQPVTKSAVGG